MNKTKFINELKHKLRNMPTEEFDSAIGYYTEYFEDAGVDDFVDVEKEFGSPSSVASQILADYAIKEKPKKNQISSIWFIILAIFASPIALPLTFALVVTVGALIFAFGAVIFAFGIAACSIAFSGGVVFISGVSVLLSEFATAILFMGVGSTMAGLGLLSLMAILALGSFFLKLIVGLSRKLLNKVNKKELI
ncbi:MAG: DUF1700 domain-containing protein [Romboutsia sp.]|uniref:DUF1700 domain-containing protein n=1 Tax=Romboutsia sp. TaxID=1965302 RepID=UPI003F2DBF24